MNNLRILFMGDSGGGKTSALYALIEAGYNVRVADFDNGTDALRIKCASASEEIKARLSIKKFKDQLVPIGDSYTLKEPLGYNSFVRSLAGWKTKTQDFGAFDKWKTKDVLVIDTLTFLCRSSMYRLQQANKKVGQRIDTRDYGNVQLDIQTVLDMVVGSPYAASVIICAHADYREYIEGTFVPVGMLERDVTGTDQRKVSTADLEVRAVPTTFGAKLGPNIGRYFNFTLGAVRKPGAHGSASKYIIQTKDHPHFELKCPLPLPKELPGETGLATVFDTWHKLGLSEE